MNTIDLSYLKDITNGENEIMAEMIELILEETPKHIQQIKKLFSNKDWPQLGAEAHKLKPLLLYVGLTKLNEATQELEQNGKKSINLDAIPDLITIIEEGFNDVSDELKSIKQQLV